MSQGAPPPPAAHVSQPSKGILGRWAGLKGPLPSPCGAGGARAPSPLRAAVRVPPSRCVGGSNDAARARPASLSIPTRSGGPRPPSPRPLHDKLDGARMGRRRYRRATAAKDSEPKPRGHRTCPRHARAMPVPRRRPSQNIGNSRRHARAMCPVPPGRAPDAHARPPSRPPLLPGNKGKGPGGEPAPAPGPDPAPPQEPWSLAGAAGPLRNPGIPGSAVSPALVSRRSWRAVPPVA
eukprot:gene24017-biopygen1315